MNSMTSADRTLTVKAKGSAVIVGASLSGLMAALALARIGMDVTLLGRSRRLRPNRACTERT